MQFLSKIFILCFVLLISCGNFTRVNKRVVKRVGSRLSKRLPANTSESVQYTLPKLTESDFNRRIDKELERHVDLIAEKLTEPEKKAFAKFKKQIMQVIIEANPWEHIKHMLVTHGTGAAVTAAVTEVITVGVLPALLTAAGLPGLAAFSAASPSFAVTVPAFIAWKNARQKKKLARELGFSDLKKLDRLREEILGFCTSKRLVSRVYDRAEGSIELSIVKRRFAKWRNPPKGAIIDLYKIKEIASEHLKPRVLEILKPLAKEDEAVYATVLVDQIQKNPSGAEALSKAVNSNIDELTVGLSNHQQTMLLLVHEKQQYISRLQMKARKFKSAVTKKLGDSKEAKKIISEFSENLITDLSTLDIDIKRFEYTFLNQISLGESVSEESVNNSSIGLLRRMRDAESSLKDFDEKFISIREDNLIIDKDRFLRDLKNNNISWLPYAARNTGGDSCVEATTRFLSQSRVSIQ